ncbi:MAG: amino acid ABC transporter permease [Oligoflexus sp.]
MYKKQLPLIYSLLTIVLLGAIFGLIWHSFISLEYDWDFSFLWHYLWEPETNRPGLILQGLWGTLYISALSILFGSITGIFIGLLLIGKEPFARHAAKLFVDVFRNTPVLVQLYVFYFIVGTALDLQPETAGILTLSLFCSAYVAEIFRGTLLEFEKGQIDAAKSIGLKPWQIARYVIAPQALRRMLPPLVGQFVSLVKDSSLVSIISVTDLTKSALNVVAVSFRSFETWFVIALIYFALNFLLSSYGRYLERRLRIST